MLLNNYHKTTTKLPLPNTDSDTVPIVSPQAVLAGLGKSKKQN